MSIMDYFAIDKAVPKSRSRYLLQITFVVVLATSLSRGQEMGEDKNPVKSNSSPNPESERAHSRQKRYVYINQASPLNVGYLVAVPYTFALPTFNLQTSRRRKRSIEQEKELLANLTQEEVLPSGSFDEPAYSLELNKMSFYFTILGVDEDICQQKLICEIFADPENHKPLSDLFAKKLTADHGPVLEQTKSRYYRYVTALQEGVSGGEPSCQTKFKRCPYSVKDRVSLPALHFWNFLINTLNIEFKDD